MPPKWPGTLSSAPKTWPLVRTKRRASNRLGVAVQLCAFRYPGRTLDPAELPPEPMLAFVAKQLGADPALFGEYARRAETRREHMIELQKLLHLGFFCSKVRKATRVGAAVQA
jgi:TnpA family transposase